MKRGYYGVNNIRENYSSHSGGNIIAYGFSQIK